MEGAGVGRLEGFECRSEMLSRVRHKLPQHNATEPKNTKDDPYFCKDRLSKVTEIKLQTPVVMRCHLFTYNRTPHG